MFLTAHASVGILIAQTIPNPWVAFVLGFFSHFIVDMIPHGDQALAIAPTAHERRQKLFRIVAIDLAVLTPLVWYLFATKDIASPIAAVFGMLGAMAPDGISGIAELTEWKIIAWFPRFQSLSHLHTRQRFEKWIVPFPVGLALQIVFTVAVLALV